MAKMLGQDILTQAEFDEFHKNEFIPMRDLTGTAIEKAQQNHKMTLALVCTSVGLGILNIVLLAVMFIK